MIPYTPDTYVIDLSIYINWIFYGIPCLLLSYDFFFLNPP